MRESSAFSLTRRFCDGRAPSSATAAWGSAAGVPVCVVPFLRDQFEIARRVKVAGAGEGLRDSRFRNVTLRDAVAVAIDDGDLPIGVIGIVLLQHPHDLGRAVTLGHQLDRQRIVAAVGEGLRLADADAGQDAFAAAAGPD